MSAAANLRRWRKDPVAFVREQFGVEPDEWQKDALAAFADPKLQRISMQACAGPGKSAVLAWCIWNFIGCYGRRGEHPKGAATSITGENLKDNLWAELAKWQHRSPYLLEAFTWQKTQIFAKDHPETWFFSARTWPKTASAEEQGKTLSGLHSKFVMAVVDESGAVPPTVLRAADQALSTGPEFGKILQAGNPISTEGMLYAAASRLKHQWHVVRITGDPDDPKRSPRIDLEWAKEQIRVYGRENPWVMSYILGLFPRTALGKLLALADLEQAMEREGEEDYRQPMILGVDVGTAMDACVIYQRRGRLLFAPKVLRGSSTVVIAAQIVEMVRELGVSTVFVDAGGPGVGVIDQLKVLGQPCVPVFFGYAADDSMRFANKRAEMWHRAAEWVKGGGILDPHTSAELCQDLLEPEATWNLKGQLILEPKERVKERLGRSTDWGDAMALTFAYPVAPPPLVDPRDKQAMARVVRPEQSYNEFAR